MRPLCASCGEKPVSRTGGRYCSLGCMGDAKAANPAIVQQAAAALAKARATGRQRYLARAVARVAHSDVRAVVTLAQRDSVTNRKALTRLLLAIEGRGYRRGWCARDKRRAA